MQNQNTLDYWLLKQLNHWMASSIFFTKQALLFNTLNLLELLIATTLVYWWFSKDSKTSQTGDKRHRVLLVLVSFIPTYLIASLLQRIFHRPRPIINVPLQVPETLQSAWNEARTFFSDYGSFPSDHAALFFIFTTVAFSINKRLGIFCCLVSVYYGALRVAIGYHWPSDIVGGALLGILVASSLLYLELRLKKVFERLVALLESRSAFVYTFGFLFLSDLGQNFATLKMLASAFGKRLFH